MNLKLIGFLTLGAMALPLAAHHSFDAEYDRNKQRDFEGTVTKVEWMNPHARFYVDVKEADGKIVNWEFELGSPNGLMRSGWKRDSLKQGDHVKLQGNLAKDGSHLANARNITLADGRRVLAGSSADGQPVAGDAGVACGGIRESLGELALVGSLQHTVRRLQAVGTRARARPGRAAALHGNQERLLCDRRVARWT